MDLKSVIKSYMETIKEKFAKLKHKSPQTENVKEKQIKELENQPYNEILQWVEGNVLKFNKLKKRLFVFENEHEKHVLYKPLYDFKKYIHLLPAWKKAGAIEFSDDDFEQCIDYASSQLFDEHADKRISLIYLVDGLQKFLGQKPQLQESLKHLKQSHLTDKIKQAIEYMDLIEGVLKKAHTPLHVSGDVNYEKEHFLSQKDSSVVEVYISKIKKIESELGQIEKYFRRSENLRDEKQLDDFMQKYGLHNDIFYRSKKINPQTGEYYFEIFEKEPLAALQEAITAMKDSEIKYFEAFNPAEPDKFIFAVESLLSRISYKKPEEFDWENNLVEIIEKNFVQNECFNKLLTGEEKISEKSAKQIIELAFQAIKETFSHSYLSLGINLEMKYESKAPREFALGSNLYTEEMKSQIVIYEDTLKSVIETLPSDEALAFVISTMFHEAGHAVDTFWNKIVRSNSTKNEFMQIAQSSQNKAKKLCELVEVEQLGQSDLFFLACLSPTLFEFIQKNGTDKAAIEDLLEKLNHAEYMESREEKVARNTSANLTKLLYSQLLFFYKDNPKALESLNKMYQSADRVAGTYYSADYLEELEDVETLTGSIFEDLSKVPEDLANLEKLCSDYEETKLSNELSEELNKKRVNLFTKFYSALSQKDRDLLLKRTLQGGHIFLLDSIMDNNLLEGIQNFEAEDLISYFRKISQVEFDKNPKSHRFLAGRISFMGINRTPENIDKLKSVFSALAEDKNVDALKHFVNYNMNEFISEEQLYTLITELPESEKEKRAYASLLYTIEGMVDRNKEDTLVHKKLKELIQEEEKRNRTRLERRSSTALISI